MLLLDTDIMIDVLRKYPPAITWLASLGSTALMLPGLVVMELIQGCRNRAEQDQVLQELGAVPIVSLGPLRMHATTPCKTLCTTN